MKANEKVLLIFAAASLTVLGIDAALASSGSKSLNTSRRACLYEKAVAFRVRVYSAAAILFPLALLLALGGHLRPALQHPLLWLGAILVPLLCGAEIDSVLETRGAGLPLAKDEVLDNESPPFLTEKGGQVSASAFALGTLLVSQKGNEDLTAAVCPIVALCLLFGAAAAVPRPQNGEPRSSEVLVFQQACLLYSVGFLVSSIGYAASLFFMKSASPLP